MCLEGLVSWASSVPIGSYSFSISSSVEFPELRGGLDGDTSFRTECCVSGSLRFCTLPAVGLRIRSHLQRKCFNPLNLASWRLLLWKMPPSLFVLLTPVQTDWIFSLACDMPWGKGWCLTDFCLGSLCSHNCAPHLKADQSKMIVLQA